jgi:beta-phosphoglucomutase-like phosphatase (HAD superfamily)
MAFFTKNSFFLAFLCLFSAFLSETKVLIFDLSDTLLKHSNFGIAQSVGFTKFIDHLVLDLKNPRTFSGAIKKHTFDMLDMAGIQQAQPGQLLAQTAFGHHSRPLPDIMCKWQAGTISGAQAIATMDSILSSPAGRKKLPSMYERRLIRRIIHTMFDANVLAHNFYPIDGAEALLKECARKGNTLMILSNFDVASFNILSQLPQVHGVFKYFRPENIILSGKVGMIKPHPAMYQHVLATHSLNPADCIFIDDRPENITGAAACGIQGILVKNQDLKAVHHQLRAMGAL